MHHLATLPDTDQVLGRHARGHAVLTAVQGLARQVETPIQAQPESILDDAVGLQAVEGSSGGGAGGNIEQLFLAQVQRLLQGRIQLPGTAPQQQPCQDQSGFQQEQ